MSEKAACDQKATVPFGFDCCSVQRLAANLISTASSGSQTMPRDWLNVLCRGP